MQIVSSGDNLHEMSMHIFWEKHKQNIVSLLSAEFAHGVVKVNRISLHIALEKKSNRMSFFFIFLKLYAVGIILRITSLMQF